MPFTCSICGETATQICARCTKDACGNHLCDKCFRCSDCCECEVALEEPIHSPNHATPAEEPAAEPASEPEPVSEPAAAIAPLEADPPAPGEPESESALP